MQDFQNVAVWQKAHSLALRVYHETKSLPRDETFGITMQLRQSVTAIASKIAEGCASGQDTDVSGNLRAAASHGTELEYLVLLAKDLALWPPVLCGELIAAGEEVRNMILGELQTT